MVAETAYFTLERSVDGGATWEMLLDQTPAAETNLIDWESLSYGDTMYRATAYTIEGASAETIITVHADSNAAWLSGGAGFGTVARLPLDPEMTFTAERERALKRYAGRSKPVAVTGKMLAGTVSYSGETSDREDDTASSDRLIELAESDSDLSLFRDTDGRRIYGQIGQVSLQRKSSEWHDGGWNSIYGFSFTLTEATV